MRFRCSVVLAVLFLAALIPLAQLPAFAQSSTTTALSVAPSAVAEGQSATLSASVTAATGPTPTGSVSFFYNHTLLASAKLNDAGSASVSLSSANVPPGTYSIDAKYSGNSSDAASTSAPVSATVLADTTTTLSSATSSYVLGQPATLTANVTAKSGNPAGTVAFYYGNILLGSATLKSGSASITETIPVSYEPGTYNVIAKYSGTSYYAPSSGSFTLSLNFAIAPASAALRPSATQQFSLSPVPSAAVTWYVNGIAGGNSSLGTISPSGLYTAPAATSALSNSITASVAADPHYTTPAAPLYVVPAGALASTGNGQVASYTVSLPAGAAVSAQFGTTASYGLNTWSVPAPTGGGSTQLLIAGMLANTIYHIQATVSLPGGLSLTDVDHPFSTTQSLPSFPTIKATPTSYTPQPGVEFLDRENTGAYITDLDGNYLWGYPLVNTTSDDYLHPFKLLADGNLLIELGPDSSNALNGIVPPTGTAFEVREVDYTNTIVRDLSMATLQANLNASGYLNSEGNQITLSDIHHDVTVNSTTGHWILIANIFKYFTGLTGYPKGVTALGDVLIDVDPNNNFAVDWVWNEFDHLDISRQPMGFPDWTHTNAIVYSPDDHNILVSIRHQNWVLKLDYNDAAGDGTILWHLGYQGDFTLTNGSGTQDWQYAQHQPSFTTPNTTGVFGLVLMDNGNDRAFPAGFTCPVALTQNSCLYSRAPIFTIDENAMTATLSHAGITAPYSSYGGNAELLDNGDIEADYCGVSGGSVIQETTPGDSPQVVLTLTTPNNTVLYRAHRVLSPYPGVTWSSDALRFQALHATHPAKQ
jgi:arylsulfate sulfotransferase